MTHRAPFASRGSLIAGTGLLLVLAAAAFFFLRREGTSWPTQAGPSEDTTTQGPAEEILAAGRRPAVIAPREGDRSRRGRIRGRAITTDGQPVAEVRVYAVGSPGGGDGTVAAADRGKQETEIVRRQFEAFDSGVPTSDGDLVATSDADGRFAFEATPEWSYRLVARGPPGYAIAHAAAQIRPPQHEGVVTFLLIEGGTIRGRVINAADAPVAATLSGVWYATAGTGGLPHVTTDPATGEFEFTGVPRGTATIRVWRAGGTLLRVHTPVPTAQPYVIRVPSGGEIAGRVTDPSGAPIKDVDLWISVAPRTAPAAGLVSGDVRTRTGEDGSYHVAGVPAGRVKTVTLLRAGSPARIEHVGAAPWTGAMVVEGSSLRLDLVLGRGGRVKGRVLDAVSRAPVTDAEVYLLPARGVSGPSHQPLRAGVDAQGGYRFDDVPFGRYAVLPIAPRHYFAPAARLEGSDPRIAAARATFVVVAVEGEAWERDLELTPGLALQGVVVDSAGSPVADAVVREANQWNVFSGASAWGVSVPFSQRPLAISGPDGCFAMENLPPQTSLSLYAAKPPLVGVAADPVRPEAAAAVPDVRLTLVMGATLIGRVVDAAGFGVRGAQIAWRSTSKQSPGVGSGSTDDEGRFRLEGVTAAVVELHAWVSGEAAARVTRSITPELTPGEVREGLELRADASSYLRGLTVDGAGQPVAAATIEIRGAKGSVRVVSQSDGSFSATVEPGHYELVPVSLVSGAPVGRGQQVRVPAEGVRVRVTGLDHTYTLIGGRVLTSDGIRVPLCTLRVEGSRGEPGWTQEIVGGEFRAEVEIAPPLTLVVSAPRDARALAINAKDARIPVAGNATDLEIVLDPGLEVKGRVLDSGGEPVAGVLVAAEGRAGVSDASGAFQMGGFARSGAVRLDVTSTSRFVGPRGLTAVPGGDPVVVRLLPAGFVAGRVVGPPGTEGLSGWVSVVGAGSAQLKADGTFRIEGLPAEGQVDVIVSLMGRDSATSSFVGRIAKNVPIGTDDLVLGVVLGVHIRGVVVSANGSPQANVVIRAEAEDGRSWTSGTNVEGRFTMGPMPAGRFTVSARTAGGASVIGTSITVDAPADDVRIVLP